MNKLLKTYDSFSKEHKTKIEGVLFTFFNQLKILVGKPKFKRLNKKFVVQIPYYTRSPRGSPVSTMLRENNLNSLALALTKVLHLKEQEVPGKLELRLVRLRYPYLDSLILTKFLSLNVDKYNFTRMQKGLFNKVPTCFQGSSELSRSPDPSSFGRSSVEKALQPLSVPYNQVLDYSSLRTSGLYCNLKTQQVAGIKLEVSGKLTTQRNIPRKTVENVHTGSFQKKAVNKQKYNADNKDFSQYTSKNKLGSFTVKVWISSYYHAL